MNDTNWLFRTGTLRILGFGLSIIAIILSSPAAQAADPATPIRIAFAPFAAPAGNPALQHAAAAIPDLLTASLSQDSHFQIVEREKINSVWSELNLTEAGLISADTVAKLGRVLSCDWLVNGSLVQVGTNTQVWIKVIDTQSSVVLDLESLPYDPANFPATAAAIGGFLAQARTRTGPHEFIALDTFADHSISSTREDWTPRLTALVEKHFLADGYGVVEREAVAPIFSEYQLQSADMTADAKRVKLQPAFWVVSGSWQWIHDTQDELSVTIDVQKMGGGEQLSNFIKPPEEVENTVVDAIQAALKDSGSVTADQAMAAEQKLRNAHLDEIIKGHGYNWSSSRFPEQTPVTSITTTDASGNPRVWMLDSNFLARQENRNQELIKTMQEAILLNPNDARAKFLEGRALYGMADSSQSRQGEMLLEEVAKSGDPVFALRAQNWLDDIRSGKISFHRDAFGNLEIATKGEPASFPISALAVTVIAAPPSTPEPSTQTNINEQPVNPASPLIQTGNTKPGTITNLMIHADNSLKISGPPPIADLDEGEITAIGIGNFLGQGQLLVACGKTLKTFDWSGSFGPGSGTDFQKFNLPIEIEDPVTSIVNDTSDIWLGTDGGGLIRIPESGAAPRIYNERDGLPMSSITALRLADRKVLIGFEQNGRSAFGYLDVATEKYHEIIPATAISEDLEKSLESPPRSPIGQIKTEDDTNTFWVTSDQGLYRLILDSRQWSLRLPAPEMPDYEPMDGLKTLSVLGGYAVALLPQGGFALYNLSEKRWSYFNLSTNLDENVATTVSIDEYVPSRLWIGSRGKITIVDLNTKKIIGECRLVRAGAIRMILTLGSAIFFIADDPSPGSYELYYLDKYKF